MSTNWFTINKCTLEGVVLEDWFPQPWKLAGETDLWSQGLHKLFWRQKPAVLLASIACEVETTGVSVQYWCALASRWLLTRTCYQLEYFRAAVRLFYRRLLPCGVISGVKQLEVSPSRFSIVPRRCYMCEMSQTVIDRSTLNLFYIHIPVGSLMWQRKIRLYVNSPAWFFSFPSINSFLGGQACTVAACGPGTRGFHLTHARCCSAANYPRVSGCLTFILCAKWRVSDEPPPQMSLHCVAVRCLFCSHLNTPHSSHCDVSKGEKWGYTDGNPDVLFTISAEIWGPVFAVCCYCAQCGAC